MRHNFKSLVSFLYVLGFDYQDTVLNLSKRIAKTRFRYVWDVVQPLIEAQQIFEELMDEIEPKHEFHQLIRTKIDLNFVRAVYEVSSIIVQVLDFFEKDDRRTISEVIPTYEFLIRYSCTETEASDHKHFTDALKRSLLCSISEQLFQKYADFEGNIVTNKMIPKRVGDAEKVAFFLSWNTSTCKLSRAVSELKATYDPQFLTTASIIEEATVDALASTSIDGLDTWKNNAISAIKNMICHLGIDEVESVDLADALQPVQIMDDDDDNFVDPELLEEEMSSQPLVGRRKSDFTEELSAYCDRHRFNQKDWSTCEFKFLYRKFSFLAVDMLKYIK